MTDSPSSFASFSALRHALHDDKPDSPWVIENSSDLAEVCRQFDGAEVLALDTEFIRERYYYPRLEVLQLSDGRKIAIIDMPAAGSLQPLADLLGNPKRRIVIHSAGEDLPILQRALGVDLIHIFDTQLAAGMSGMENRMSLARLLGAILHLTVSKDHQTSDWSRRPLSPEQIAYAAQDVRHLHALYASLRQRLEELGRMPWFLNEQEARARALLEAPPTPDSDCYRQIKNWKTLSLENLAILRELAGWREKTARERNIPRGSILSDDALIEITRSRPKTPDDIRKIRFINVGQAQKLFPEIAKAIADGLACPPELRPAKPKDKRVELPTGAVELCRAVLQLEAERQKIAPELIATVGDVEYLIEHRREWRNKDIALLKGWRMQAGGQRVLDLLDGKIALQIGENGQIKLIETHAV